MYAVILALLLIASPAQASFIDDQSAAIAAINRATALSHCSGTTWNTYTDFWMDFDHTLGNTVACITGDTETGTGDYVATPVLVSPGSGADAQLADANSEYSVFDNAGAYFTSQYGELMFKVKVAGDNTGHDIILRAQQTAFQDEFFMELRDTGVLRAGWEDNNGTVVTISIIDIDTFYGDWIQMHIKWDTTRCVSAADDCDGVGEDEFCGRYRVDDNRDGDFADGGSEDWSAYVCESSAIDFDTWAGEPSTDDIMIGLTTATFSQNIDIDDVEISNAQPAW